MTFGVDYAWAPHPSVSALQNAGVRFVCRYLSPDSSKNLSLAEAGSLSDAGIWIVVVWESTANRALDGFEAGAQDARHADQQANGCDIPVGRPIYFAVDFDSSASDQTAINSYLDGAASVLGKDRVGIYGGYWPVKRAMDGGHAVWGWQTYAWSGGNWDDRAQIQQYSNDRIIDGVGLDFDRATKDDYGQWMVGKKPATGPSGGGGQPPVQKPAKEEPLIGNLNTGKGAVTPIGWPVGAAKAIGLFADTGLAGGQPVKLRVAYHAGGGNYVVAHVTLDSKSGKTVVSFGNNADKVDAVSVQREDDGLVPVAWDAS